MIDLKEKEFDPLDILSNLESKYARKLQLNYQDIKETVSNENDEIDTENFIHVLSELNSSVEQQDYDSLIGNLIDIFMLLNNQVYLSQDIISAIQTSNFFQNVETCIDVLSQPEINILFFVLEFLSYLSNDLIEQMFENGILNKIMELYVNNDNRESAIILLYIFGNSCSLMNISECFQEVLFNSLYEFLPNDSIPLKASCIYCLFILTKYFRMPDHLTCNFFVSFKEILQNYMRNITEIEKETEIIENSKDDKDCKHDENDKDQYETNEYCDYESDEYDESQNEKNEDEDILVSLNKKISNQKYYDKMLNYIIDILGKYSKEASDYIVVTAIPSFLLGIINFFSDDVKFKFLSIIKNTLQNIPKENGVEIFKHSETASDVYIIANLLDLSDNSITAVIYDILYEIELIDPLLIRDLISKNLIHRSIDLIISVDIYAKISILNFLSLIYTHDVSNDFSGDIINEQFIDELVEMKEQSEDLIIFEGSKEVLVSEKLKPCYMGALTKLLIDKPELNSILEPFVIGNCD